MTKRNPGSGAVSATAISQPSQRTTRGKKYAMENQIWTDDHRPARAKLNSCPYPLGIVNEDSVFIEVLSEVNASFPATRSQKPGR